LADEKFIVYSPNYLKIEFTVSGRLQTNANFVQFNQIQDVTIGGVRQVRNLGNALNRYDYSVIVLSAAQDPASYTASSTRMFDFFGSTHTNGAVNDFRWYDQDGETKDVRMISDNISVTTLSNDYQLFSFTLEEVNT